MTNMIEKAFLFALKVHGGQTRKDGKPYITHPFSVAMELANNGANDELICAGLFRCCTSMLKGDRWGEEMRKKALELLRSKLIPFVNAQTEN